MKRCAWMVHVSSEYGRCMKNACGQGVYGDGYCREHYWENRHTVLLEALVGSQPTHPDQLPVPPKRVEWTTAGWVAYMPLPVSGDHQPCRAHPEDFYAEEHDRASSSTEKWKRAMSSCMACPDRVPCAEYGLAHSRDFGIWGGTTPKDRKRILKARGQVSVELHTTWNREDTKREAS